MMRIEDYTLWLDSQLCGRKFNYGNIHGCAFASFLNEKAAPGFRYTVGGWFYTQYKFDASGDGSEVRHSLPDWARDLASVLNNKGLPFTAANLRANLP